MIKIRKASAGSGKTHLLSQTYLDLLRERYAYRHILAVTFTNKATAEMKERILRDLKRRSENDENAKTMLSDILHDYSAFSVSTIDKFFQRAIKAFAREIGQMSDYQVELDRDGLIAEAMDRVQEQLTLDDTEVLLWLKNYMKGCLIAGAAIDMDDQLFEMGKKLKNAGIDDPSDFSRDRLKKVRENCDEIIRQFHKDIREAALKCEVEKSNDFIAEYRRERKDNERLKFPTQKTLVEEAAGTEFMDMLSGKRFIWYNTAIIIRKSLFSLGLAAEFLRCFNEILKERGIMCLDDSNVLLEKIIAGSEAPFVYEKMGVRYTNFLLDEFQDTSNIQWNNFRPLLRESESYGNENLIVGDVKQSIYRWRDSDWELLAHHVKDEFPEADEKSMEYNWRSLKTIREFNNSFFSAARAILGDPKLYGDVVQKEPDKRVKDEQEGFVKVTFCDKKEEMDQVLESIHKAMEAGASLGDIIVLVRWRKEGSALARFLLESGVSVISEEFLTISNSPVVRRLVALLASHDDNQDKISDYLADKGQITFPDEYHSLMDLCEQLLRQIKIQDEASFEGQTLYINAFLDCIKDWSDLKGEDLHDFLAYWNEKKDGLSICTPDNKNAVRIMTIHKAKGLEAPYVIFPYLDKVEIYRADCKWCKLETEGTPFCPEAAGMYPVDLDSSAGISLFAPYYNEERGKQLADNLNTVYVAFTRASKCFHVISADVTKKFLDKNPGPSGSFAESDMYANFSQILYQFCSLGPGGKPGGFDIEYGKMYDFTRTSSTGRPLRPEPEQFESEFSSYDFSHRLRGSQEAAEFFEGLDSQEESARQVGTNLHGILEKVEYASDLERAVSDAIQDGLVNEEEGKEAYEMLKKAIASRPEFFPVDAEIRNEIDIFDKNGEALRPDRVIIKEGCVTIVDYKFGERHASYHAQVRAYMQLYRDMGEGYREVKGYLWYVKTGEIEQVEG